LRVDHGGAPVGRDADLVQRRPVDDGLHPAARLGQGGLVGQVPLDQVAAEVAQRGRLRGCAHEGPHVVTTSAQQTSDLPADETGATGQEDAHKGSL
jgi:hypothetical protein